MTSTENAAGTHKSHILWFILFIIMITPISTPAQTQLEDEIQQIDITANQIALKRSAVRKEIRNQILFAKNAEDWFAKLNQINAKIRRAKANNGEFATFNATQINNALHQLQKERSNILRLNGGTNLNGQTFTSMQQLKAAYNNPEYKNQLEKEYRDLSQQLNQLDNQRNALSQRIKENEKRDLTWNKIQVETIKDDLKDLEFIANNSKIWCINGFWFGVDCPPYMTRKMAMEQITNHYLKQIRTPPKKKFDPDKLAYLIKTVQVESNKTKEYIRNTAIPEKQQLLTELQQKIMEANNPDIDISGCWVIYISNQDYPVITIQKNFNGYSGFITSVGVLDYVHRGDLLFAVHPINKLVFEGLEYSYDPKGNQTTTRLQLIADKNGNRMHYRGDDVLEMGRCQ